MLPGALHLCYKSLDTQKHRVGIAYPVSRESAFGRCYIEVAITYRSRDERWIGLLHDILKPVVQHRTDDVAYISALVFFESVALLTGRGLTLHVEGEVNRWLLFVCCCKYYHLLVVRYRIVNTRLSIRLCRYSAKDTLHFSLNSLNVYVAYHNDGLQIGAIPLAVIIT